MELLKSLEEVEGGNATASSTRDDHLKTNFTNSEMKLSMNLLFLQKKDPTIQSILCNFEHVVLYKFNSKSNEWKMEDVEGSMFVVKRNKDVQNGCYRLIILNRRSTRNFAQDLSSTMELQLQLPFVFYRVKPSSSTSTFTSPSKTPQQQNTPVIFGIWFYNSVQSMQFFNQVNQIINECKDSESTQETSSQPSVTKTPVKQIQKSPQMLQQASEAMRQKQQKETQSKHLSANDFQSFLQQHNITFGMMNNSEDTPPVPQQPLQPPVDTTSEQHHFMNLLQQLQSSSIASSVQQSAPTIPQQQKHYDYLPMYLHMWFPSAKEQGSIMTPHQLREYLIETLMKEHEPENEKDETTNFLLDQFYQAYLSVQKPSDEKNL